MARGGIEWREGRTRGWGGGEGSGKGEVGGVARWLLGVDARVYTLLKCVHVHAFLAV